MKNIALWLRLFLLALVLANANSLRAETARAGAVPPPGPLPTPVPTAPMRQRTLSKDGTATLLPSRFEATLRANLASDQTKEFLPDGCRLSVDELNLQLIPGGVGRFQSPVKFIAPDGKILMLGTIRGISGLTATRGDGQRSRKAGHFEGVVEAGEVPSTGGGTGTVEPGTPSLPPTVGPARLLTASFTADIQTDVEPPPPQPILRVHLDGVLLLPPLPPPAMVSIVSDHLLYPAGAPITAIIRNPTRRAIYVFDEQSLCTIVQLQKREGALWTPQFSCPLARPPIATKIAANETLRVLLKPSGATAIEPGTYRLALAFSATPGGQPASAETTIYSPQFRVAGEPPTGSVTVTPDRQVYRTTDTIVATIENGTETAIRTEDHQSFCTVLSLLRRTQKGWEPTAACLTLSPTQFVTIAAQGKLQVSLPEVTPAIYPPQPNFVPGEYRLELSFVALDANGKPDAERQTASSAPFLVQDVAGEGVQGLATEELIGGPPPPDGVPIVIIRPLPGAILILQTPDGTREIGRAVANAEGRYRIAAPAGAYRLVGRRPGNSGLPVPEPIPVRIAAGTSTEVNVKFVTPLPSPPPTFGTATRLELALDRR